MNSIGITQLLMVTAADVGNVLRFQREIGLAFQSVMIVELYRL